MVNQSLKFVSIVTLIVQTGFAQYLVHQEDGCTCPGEVVTYECTININGTIATVWQGTALNCPENGNKIILLHNQFPQNKLKTCNDGDIVGHGIAPIGNSTRYISRLNVTVISSLEGKTIECAVDNGVMTTILQNFTLKLTTDPLYPPNVTSQWSMSSENYITFAWEPPIANCSQISYRLKSINCGNCTNGTEVQVNNVTCTNIIANGRKCNFSIKAIVCGNIVGDASKPVIINLKDAPRKYSSAAIIGGAVGSVAAVLCIVIMTTVCIIVCIVRYRKRTHVKKKRVREDFSLKESSQNKSCGDQTVDNTAQNTIKEGSSSACDNTAKNTDMKERISINQLKRHDGESSNQKPKIGQKETTNDNSTDFSRFFTLSYWLSYW